MEWVEIISSVGFPIACCVYLFYSNSVSDQRHKEEIDSLRLALENNTNVLTQLLERLK